MGVRVKLYSRLREAGGVDEIVLEETPSTVGELVETLAKKLGDEFRKMVYGEDGKTLRGNIMLLVNGHSVRLLKGLETPLREDDSVSLDVIDVMEIVGGG